MLNLFCPRSARAFDDLAASDDDPRNAPPPPPPPPPRATRRGGGSPSIPSLRENMTRARGARLDDPFSRFEAVRILGAGSAGSVAEVKKKKRKVGRAAGGGTARAAESVGTRRSLLDSRRGATMVEGVLVPGGIFGWCVRGASGYGGKSTSLATTTSGSCDSTDEECSATSWSSRDGDHGGARECFLPKRRTSAASAGHEPHYALKCTRLDRIKHEATMRELRNEIQVLKELDHPYIVKPLETFEYRRQMYVVMELCSGGDLYTRDPYDEAEAARIVRMILSAVNHMHERGIVHRDLKYENVMFANKSPQSEIKLIDFGISKRYLPGQPDLIDGAGTVYTMAPEVFRRKYTSKIDVWAVGVLAYMLLSSHIPFYGATRQDVAAMIKKGKFTFKARRWRKVSKRAKSFVAELLRANPDERPTAGEARRSLWLRGSSAASVDLGPEEEEVMRDVVGSIRTFATYGKLKRLALMVIAHRSTSEEVGVLRKAFRRYDMAKTGIVTREQFQSCLDRCGYSEEELDDMFHGADIDGTGLIKYTEFLAATIEATGLINEEKLAEAFDFLDVDGSGHISDDNLRSFLGEDFPQEEIDKMIADADVTNTKQISYADFLSLWDNGGNRDE